MTVMALIGVLAVICFSIVIRVFQGHSGDWSLVVVAVALIVGIVVTANSGRRRDEPGPGEPPEDAP